MQQECWSGCVNTFIWSIEAHKSASWDVFTGKLSIKKSSNGTDLGENSQKENFHRNGIHIGK